MTRLPWGYKRPDSKHFMSNAKLETILKNGWPWRFLIGAGRIVVLSGLASNHGMNNLPPDVDAHLVKPIDFEVLHEHILR